MAFEMEQVLRDTPLEASEKLTIFRGIVQVAQADGEMDPREKEYLQQVVTEFFPGENFSALLADYRPLTEADLGTFSSEEARVCFAAFLFMTAYADEEFSESERTLLSQLTAGVLPASRVEELQAGVRHYLYRRAIFHFVLNQNFLHPEFAREMARRFEVPENTAVALNQEVYNAVLILHGAPQNAEA
jgi:uncharacterized tellurite resistance protein B-like protein